MTQQKSEVWVYTNDLALWGATGIALPMWVVDEEADFSEQKLLDIPPQEKSQRKHQSLRRKSFTKKTNYCCKGVIKCFIYNYTEGPPDYLVAKKF